MYRNLFTIVNVVDQVFDTKLWSLENATSVSDIYISGTCPLVQTKLCRSEQIQAGRFNSYINAT